MQDREITGVGDALGAALDRFRAEKEPVILIGVLVGLLNMMLMKSLLATYVDAVQNFGGNATPDDVSAAILGGDFTFGFVLITLVSLIAYVLYGRLLVVGREGIFEGGPRAFINRLMWSLWRYICLIGWILAIFFPYTFMVYIGGMLGGGLAGLVMSAALVFLIAAIVSLSLSFSVSVVAASNDIAVPIRKAWLALRGYHVRFSLSFLAMVVGLFIIAILLMSIFVALGVVNPDGEITIGMSIYYVIYMTLTSIIGFIIFGMAYFLARNGVDEQSSIEAGNDP